MWLPPAGYVSHPERVVQFSRSFHAYGHSFTQAEERGARGASQEDSVSAHFETKIPLEHARTGDGSGSSRQQRCRATFQRSAAAACPKCNSNEARPTRASVDDASAGKSGLSESGC